MIGDGHYLNTILELGPTPVATAVRLETTLMRREMMGHPAPPSSFINSDKMVSTLSQNAAQPPSTSSFSLSVTLRAFIYTVSLPYFFLSSLYFCFIEHLNSGTSLAIHAYDSPLSNPVWALLISCPCLLCVQLKGVLLHGSCLSLPTCCSLEGWLQSGSKKIDRTLRCCALCYHAPSQQVGKSEGCWLAQYGRPQGMGCLEAPHAHRRVRSTLHANEAKRSLCAPGQNCAKTKKNSFRGWYVWAEK